MSRWLVELQGEQFDKDLVAEQFPSGKVFAIQEDGNVFLTGASLDDSDKPEQVLEIATEAFEAFTSIISIFEPSFIKPGLTTVWLEDDNRKRSGFALASANLIGRSRVTAKLTTTNHNNENELTRSQIFLSSAIAEPNLRAAMLIWANDKKTWGRLYCVLENVESYLNKHVNTVGFCTKSERTRFTSTANNAEAAGLEARHGSGRFALPSQPMSLEEATSFIRELLVKALTRAAQNS